MGPPGGGGPPIPVLGRNQSRPSGLGRVYRVDIVDIMDRVDRVDKVELPGRNGRLAPVPSSGTGSRVGRRA